MARDNWDLSELPIDANDVEVSAIIVLDSSQPNWNSMPSVDLQFPIAGMHIGCQSLLMNDFPAQSRQRVALCCGQASAKIGFVFGG